MQIYSTSIIFVILIFIIWFFLSKRSTSIGKNFNLIIECDKRKNKEYFDKILVALKNNCQETEMVKIEKQDETIMLFYKISFEDNQNIKKLIDIFESELNVIKFTLYENKSID